MTDPDTERKRALVLVSGGIDSTVALWWAQAEGYDVLPLTFHYYKRAPQEIDATFRLLCRAHLTDALLEVELPFLKEVYDLKKEGPLENVALYDSPEGYIPARNLVFYALGAYYAEVHRASKVIGGHNGVDPEAFPDSSPKFFNFVSNLLRIGVWSYKDSPVEILQPLSGMEKWEVIQRGLDLGVPFEDTWSCNWPRDVHCGRCRSCLEREEAFAAVGARDPVPYEA